MSAATLVQSAPPPLGLDVLLSAEGATTVLALRGEADIATLPVVVDALARVIADRDDDVVVDLAQTDFMDTAALRAVLQAREDLHGGERQLTLRSPSRIAGRLVAVFGLSQLVSQAPAPMRHRSPKPKGKVRQMNLLVTLLIVFLIALVAGWGWRAAKGRR